MIIILLLWIPSIPILLIPILLSEEKLEERD
jgi:hypothetical protein